MRFIGEYYKTFFRAGEAREKRVIKKFLKRLGPGFTTGASDDDPSGILTYLQGGAMLGFGALWTALATLPMMYGIQEMSGRIGLVTEKGLIRIIKERYPKYILFIIAFISTVVITINIVSFGAVHRGNYYSWNRIFFLSEIRARSYMAYAHAFLLCAGGFVHQH